jgi:hypothetical protein
MPTVTAGQSVTFALTMFAASGSNLSFTMTCAGLPANSSCAFSPNPFAPGPPPNGSQVQVTFSTRAASFSVPLSRQGKPGPLPIDLLGFGGLVAAIAGLFAKRSNKPNRRLGWVTIAAVTVLAVAIVGCGGGGGPSPTVTPSGGTPKGISNITVTATSASTTMTKTIAVNVQ